MGREEYKMLHSIPHKVFIFGAGGFSKEVKWLVEEIPGYDFISFIDEDDEYDFHQLLRDNLSQHFYSVIGIGIPKIRKRVYTNFSDHDNLHWPTLIHPVVIGDFPNIKFGKGCIICAGNVFTTDIKIGDFNIFNLNSTLGHDLHTGDYCVINPNCSTSANVTLTGENLVGVGSTILASRTLGKGAILGAGALLTKDIPDGEVWAGVPAKILEV